MYMDDIKLFANEKELETLIHAVRALIYISVFNRIEINLLLLYN